METVELMFDGELKEATLQDDRNNELLYVTEDGRFVKFPKNSDLGEVITAYNEANSMPVEFVEDVEYGLVETNK